MQNVIKNVMEWLFMLGYPVQTDFESAEIKTSF